MVANPERRQLILDAALACLGAEGARGLTHRAVDRRAELPAGTTANYFATRSALILAMAERIYERIAPDPARLAAVAASDHGAAAVVAYVEYIVERLLGVPELALALIELRLEAARTPAVAGVLAPFLRGGLAADQQFHADAQLPGGDLEIELLHYAIDGLILDRLTVPLHPEADPKERARLLTRRVLRAPN